MNYLIAHPGQDHSRQNAYVDDSRTEARLLHNAICREDSDGRIATYGRCEINAKPPDITYTVIGVSSLKNRPSVKIHGFFFGCAKTCPACGHIKEAEK